MVLEANRRPTSGTPSPGLAEMKPRKAASARRSPKATTRGLGPKAPHSAPSSPSGSDMAGHGLKDALNFSSMARDLEQAQTDWIRYEQQTSEMMDRLQDQLAAECRENIR